MLAMVEENVENIRQRIAGACRRAGRTPEEVKLIAVTKTFDSASLREAIRAGIRDFGENFVQELTRKRDELRENEVRWHFIGHLQSNKVKHIIGWIHLIHSVDSLSLAKEISKRAKQADRTVDLLVEVNTSGEQSKFGVAPHDAPTLVERLRDLPNINVGGLMTIGPFLPDAELSRPSFRALRELRDKLRKDGQVLPDLSMGMTGDFEVAIEEGATMIRLGTAIFGKRLKNHKQFHEESAE